MSETMSGLALTQPPTGNEGLTGYIVLRGVDDADTWATTISGVVFARNADEAIKKAAGDTAGTYVAVPARSWTPRTLKVEQTTRVRLD